MPTDIHRLHQVVLGELRGRRVGKTFAACHEVVGDILVDSLGMVVCVVKFERDVNWIVPMLVEVMAEYGLTVSKCRELRYMCNGKVIQFISSLRLNNSIITQDYNLVNFVDY